MKYLYMLLLACVSWLAATAQSTTNKDVLELLDKEIALKSEYDRGKQARIDSLRQLLPSLNRHDISQKMCQLGLEYETFISDSALSYYDQAIVAARSIKDSTLITKAKLGKIKVLGIMGFFHEAILELSELEANGIEPSLREEWLDCGRQLYSYIEAYTLQSNSKKTEEYLTHYREKQLHYRTEQLKLLNPGSLRYKLFCAEQYFIDGKYPMAKKLLTEILNDTLPNNNIYARAAANMAMIREDEENPADAAKYLALSAIADIKTSVKETSSLQKLAFYLYEEGDINHAYDYISASLADAVFCNARLRTTEISNILPLIDHAYKAELREKQKLLMFATLISTLLTIAFVGVCIFLLKQMRKLNATRQQLKNANSIKDEYMGHFLDLCSIYMDRLDNFTKTVSRKITAGQVEDLVKMAKSTKFAEEQHKQFYENFDGAFLHIYPTFIEDFNKLLLPEERIEVKDPGKLTTELRIFAFVRMGMDDASKIANFLHYSVNTIYAYRNKIKNKAIDRDHFEENVMKIGSIL